MKQFNLWSPGRKALIISAVFPVLAVIYTALKTNSTPDSTFSGPFGVGGLFVVGYPIIGLVLGLLSFLLLYMFFRSNK